MINIAVGKPGRGKTLFLVSEAIRNLNLGRDVYSNFFIDQKYLEKNKYLKQVHGNIIGWSKIEDLVKIKVDPHSRGALIIIDECQIYFNSRLWKFLPPKVQYKFQQHRKHGLDILGAVQNVKRIDTVVRELVNNIYEMDHFGNLFIARQFDIGDIDKVKRPWPMLKFFWLNKKKFRCYDTFREVDSKI